MDSGIFAAGRGVHRTEVDRFLDDARRQEDQQLGLFAAAPRRLEQVAEIRYVAEERDLGHVVVDRFFVDAADDRGVAVVDGDLRDDVLGVDRRHESAAGDRHELADRVLADFDRHDDAVVRRDLRRHVETQHGLLELHGRRAVGGARSHIGNLGALLDARLLVVRGHDARAGDDLAAAVGFERRQLEIDQVAAAQVDQRQRNLSGRVGDRQVDVELRRIRVAGVCDSRRELKRRLRARFADADVARYR